MYIPLITNMTSDTISHPFTNGFVTDVTDRGRCYCDSGNVDEEILPIETYHDF